MALRYEAWGGPADGIFINLDHDMQHLDYVYLQLPLRGKQVVFKSPPRAPYAIYKLGCPKDDKAQWAGDVLTNTGDNND